MLWPLSMVSRTSMRAVAWPGAIWSIWMPGWREARSASYILAAERWATAWGASCTRPPRTGGLRDGPSANHDDPVRLWVAAGGRRVRDGVAGDRVRVAGRGAGPGGGCGAGGADLRGLPGARPAARRGAEGGRGVLGRPVAGADG